MAVGPVVMFSIPLPIITAALAAALAGAGAWTAQGWRMGERIQAMQAQAALAAHKQLEQAHAETLRLQAQADAAARQHAARAAKMANDVNASRSAADGLRNDLAAMLMSGNTCTANNHETISGLLAECGQRYSSMAAEADKRASEVILLLEAWPSSKP